MTEKVGMPTMSGAKDSLMDFGVGLAGGIIYALSQSFTGSGFIGGIVGAIAAGSIVKGVRGTAIATMLGFQTIVGASGASASASASETSGGRGVM